MTDVPGSTPAPAAIDRSAASAPRPQLGPDQAGLGVLAVLAGAAALVAGIWTHGAARLVLPAVAGAAAVLLVATAVAITHRRAARLRGQARAAAALLACLVAGVGAVATGDPTPLAVLALVALALGPLLAGSAAFVPASLAVWALAALAAGSTALLDPPLTRPWAWLGISVLVPVASAAAAVCRGQLVTLRAQLLTAGRSADALSVRDELTGLANRRGLEMVAQPMLEHARRKGEALHCLFIDVDGFRAVNEALGSAAGDDLLRAVGEVVSTSTRATDVVARWAGDELVVIGPGTGMSPLEMERRVRGRLAEQAVVPPEVWTPRVSVGSATLVPWDEGDLDGLLRKADQDMNLRRSLRRQTALPRREPSDGGLVNRDL